MNHIWARYADKRYGAVMRALSLRLALSRAALWLEVLVRRFWGWAGRSGCFRAPRPESSR